MSGQILADTVISKGSTLFKLPDTFPKIVNKAGTINNIYNSGGIYDLFLTDNMVTCRYDDLPFSWFTINQVWVI